MVRIILDQNVLSDIADDSEFAQLFSRAQQSGITKPLWTHVHLDQSNAIPDVDKRDRTLFIIRNCGSTTETWGHDDDLSRSGWSYPSPPEALEEILGNQTPKGGNLYDALLASTAARKANALVTNDKRLKNRCRTLGSPAMSGDEFKEYLSEKLSDPDV